MNCKRGMEGGGGRIKVGRKVYQKTVIITVTNVEKQKKKNIKINCNSVYLQYCVSIIEIKPFYFY